MGKPRAQFLTISPRFEKVILSRHRLTASDARKVNCSCNILKQLMQESNLHLPYGGEREGAEVSGKEYNTDDNHRIITLAPT